MIRIFLFLASLTLSVFLSIILIWLTSFTVVFVGNEDSTQPEVLIDEDRTYTNFELDAREDLARKMFNSYLQNNEIPDGRDFYIEARKRSFVFDWMPWLIVTVIFRVRNYLYLAIVIPTLSILISIGLFTVIQSLLYFLASSLAIIYIRLRNRKNQSEHSDSPSGSS